MPCDMSALHTHTLYYNVCTKFKKIMIAIILELSLISIRFGEISQISGYISGFRFDLVKLSTKCTKFFLSGYYSINMCRPLFEPWLSLRIGSLRAGKSGAGLVGFNQTLENIMEPASGEGMRARERIKMNFDMYFSLRVKKRNNHNHCVAFSPGGGGDRKPIC